MRLKEHILAYVLLPLIVILICASYFRFMVNNDYLVAYEGTCDPILHSCFVGCQDDDDSAVCANTYYYDKVQKYAVDVYAQCGKDITECEAANICLSRNDRQCTITFCDPVIDGDVCEAFVVEPENTAGDDTLIESTLNP